jgi:hypothetical protein
VAVVHMISKPKSKSTPLKTLQSLPTELLIKVATLLAPIDRASLAFTSSWLHSIFGNALKLNQLDRWTFLRRLEDNNMWPSEVLCEICQKFHEPRKSRRFTPKEGQRACIGNGSLALQRMVMSPYLSREIHFDVMAAISRSHHFTPDLPLPGEPSVQFVAPYANDENELVIRLQQSVHFSAEGHVLIKSQRVLFPGRNAGRGTHKVLEGTGILHRFLSETYELGTICGHAKWADLYPFISSPDKDFEWPRGQWSFRHSSLQDFDLPGEELQECLWTHKGDCWVNCQARARLDSALEGRVWSCGGCSTDYAVNIIRSENSCANFIVMTSWKDLGTCLRRDDPLWKEHMNFGVHAGHRREEVGNIAGEIENLRRGPGGHTYYFPHISRQRLRKMFIDGEGCEEKAITRDVEVDL